MTNKETIDELKKIWEPKKEYIEKDLWVIRNFLTEQELSWLNEESNDPSGWYSTMRSPYGGNIRNKFLGYIPEYFENGEMILPSGISKYRPTPLKDDIEARLAAVLPEYFNGAGALQSLFEVPDEEIISQMGHNVDFAIDWHYERDDSDDDEVQRYVVSSSDSSKNVISKGKITAAFNVYINDNFQGGILEFKNKEYKIKPEPGMLINIPLYKEFEHRVTKVTNGNRHTLYGRCWDDPENAHYSSNEDC